MAQVTVVRELVHGRARKSTLIVGLCEGANGNDCGRAVQFSGKSVLDDAGESAATAQRLSPEDPGNVAVAQALHDLLGSYTSESGVNDDDIRVGKIRKCPVRVTSDSPATGSPSREN